MNIMKSKGIKNSRNFNISNAKINILEYAIDKITKNFSLCA